MKIRNILLIASLSFIVLFSACSKEKTEEKIVGTWHQISVGHIPEDTEIVWSFEEDNSLVVTRYKNGNLDKTGSATWELKMRFARKNQLEIKDYTYDFDGANRNGTYLIQELGDHLKLQRTESEDDAPFLWMEFKKE